MFKQKYKRSEWFEGLLEAIGPSEFYDFDSSYQYWIVEWEVV